MSVEVGFDIPDVNQLIAALEAAAGGRPQPQFYCNECSCWAQSGHTCEPPPPPPPPVALNPGQPDPLPQVEWREPLPSWLPLTLLHDDPSKGYKTKA